MTEILLAEFATAHGAADAARRAARAGTPAVDVLSPNPIDGIAEHLAPPPARAPVGWVMFIAGAMGAILGYFMQWYSAAVAYPIDSGGRPLNSWPVFLPVAYEITILLAGICGMLGWIAMCGLPKLHHPLFVADAFERASQDRYFLLFREIDQASIETDLDPVAIHAIDE